VKLSPGVVILCLPLQSSKQYRAFTLGPGVNEGVNFTPREQISPLGARVKSRMALGIMQHYKVLKPYTLARFEPTIFCSDAGGDEHYIHYAAGVSVQLLEFPK
jgi:hypothetical protein